MQIFYDFFENILFRWYLNNHTVVKCNFVLAKKHTDNTDFTDLNGFFLPLLRPIIYLDKSIKKCGSLTILVKTLYCNKFCLFERSEKTYLWLTTR
ncbi:MAG: hypothetical protein EAZ06_11345 [Cytophagales bacterium]|nr:MAG: hypothetical protein EAY69_03610 [Cytophagales bacterium]TAH28062.1 MAG: hypothetical protein EAZ06_11345 [Cytophagales bacterium]